MAFNIPKEQSSLRWSVESVLSSLALQPSSQQPTSPIPFFHLLERLKTTKREGWRRFGIKDGESISDHMYRMSIITMLAPKSLASRIDVSRCTKMALIHDMAESLVGDITPKDNVPKNEKNRRESETMDYLTEYLLGTIAGGGTEVGIDIREIWQEYEDNETLEAKFVHDVDKLELLLQMVEYEKQKSDPEKPESKLDLGEFSWVAKKIELPEVKAWCVEVLREREQYWKQLGIRASALDFGRTIVDHLDA